MKEQAGRIGNLPANINIMNPVPNKDAKTITGLIRKNGKVSGYELSDGRVLSKREGVAWPSRAASVAWPSPAATAASTCALCPMAAKATTWVICPPLPTGFADTQPAPTGAQKAPGRFPGQGLLYHVI